MTTRPWQPLRTERISRRSLLKGSSGASVGAAGLALVGCGDNDDETIRELLDEIDGLEDVFDEAQVDSGGAAPARLSVLIGARGKPGRGRISTTTSASRA